MIVIGYRVSGGDFDSCDRGVGCDSWGDWWVSGEIWVWLLVGRGIGDSGFWTGGDSGVSGSGSSVFFDVS